MGFQKATTTVVRRCVLGALLLVVAPCVSFAAGWSLVQEGSTLNFQSVKNKVTVELNKFTSFDGSIAPDGKAVVTIQLDSIDTGIDLRNVRMRFLFFETFKYPAATITLRVDPAALADLPRLRRKLQHVTYNLELHGTTIRKEADVMVTMLAPDRISVASIAPLPIAAAEFGLSDSVRKLEDAASVSITPTGMVSFDFLFQAAPGAGPATRGIRRATVPLEPLGNFSAEACAGRFEIISRTGAIYFPTGSARLAADSRPLLDSVVAIVARCPGLDIQVAGHTDSVGPEDLNQTLSEARARAVTAFLVHAGVPATRLRAVGYGETRPVAPNDSAWNMSRNRRIEFSAAAAR